MAANRWLSRSTVVCWSATDGWPVNDQVATTSPLGATGAPSVEPLDEARIATTPTASANTSTATISPPRARRRFRRVSATTMAVRASTRRRTSSPAVGGVTSSRSANIVGLLDGGGGVLGRVATAVGRLVAPEAGSECGKSPRRMLLDRTGGDPEHLGHLPFGAVTDVAEQYDLPLPPRERPQGANQIRAVIDGQVGVGRRRGRGRWRAPSHLVQGEVGGGAHDPRFAVAGDVVPPRL